MEGGGRGGAIAEPKERGRELTRNHTDVMESDIVGVCVCGGVRLKTQREIWFWSTTWERATRNPSGAKASRFGERSWDCAAGTPDNTAMEVDLETGDSHTPQGGGAGIDSF